MAERQSSDMHLKQTSLNKFIIRGNTQSKLIR